MIYPDDIPRLDNKGIKEQGLIIRRMIVTKWITAMEYQKLAYVGNPPSLSTIWRWCKKGDLPAKKLGGTWHINAKVLKQTGNSLADSVINN